jgi:signal transduction histidine kinase
VTFQRKLLLGVSGMVLPALLVGAEAIRSNALERHALEALGTSLGRNRTYAELETAMFNQSEVLWQHLTGMDPTARKEFGLSGQVVQYWYERWKAELDPGDTTVAQAVLEIQRQYVALGDSVFRLTDAGQHQRAYQVAAEGLKARLQPALTALNRQVYRRNRESSVSATFARVNEIVDAERRTLVIILATTLVLGLVAAWAMARSLVRPLTELRQTMNVVGAGKLDHPIDTTRQDEIGDLARAFGSMIEKLKEAQAQLLQAERLASIGEMSAAVAHGLRNPLASLSASAQLVRKHPESPAAKEQLQAIIDEVGRLDRRITHLLTFSRPAPVQPMAEEVGSVIRSVLPTFAERARRQGVEIVDEIPADLPELQLDPMKLEQALVEPLANALDAMPAGGRVTIAARSTGEKDHAGIEIRISDTGRGIPDVTLQQVGQPFFTTRQEGTGLGVATAKRFVQQHGGTLGLTSRVGQGTTATIWLPRSSMPETPRTGRDT